MRTRILPPEEWPRLIGTEAELAFPLVDPLAAEVLVVEEGDEIIGTWMLLKVVHAECIWIAPKHRGTFGVAKRLIKGMRELASSWGVQSVVTGSVDPKVTDLILRLGGKPMPCESFILPVEGRKDQDKARGRSFHAQLSAFVPENHPDDETHDEMVGRTLRRAIEDHQPEFAVEEYNVWAGKAGYEPISYFGTFDGWLRADIASTIIEVDQSYRVRPFQATLKREALCRS